MIDLANMHAIDGAALAFIAGLWSSPHCVGMCGPLGCSAIFANATRPQDAQFTALFYHLSRCLSYCCIGALFGLIGGFPLQLFNSKPASIIAWLLAATFLWLFLQRNKLIPKRWHLFYIKTVNRLRFLPRGASGLLLGVLTPFLPCGPLYLIFLVCGLSGSAIKGAEVGLGFALGTIPLLWLAQSQYIRFYPKFKNSKMRWLPNALGICATVVIFWRITMSGSEINDLFCHSW